jgi:peptidylprolyl isomerase
LRKIIAVAAAASLSLTLAGCSSTNPADELFAGVKQTCETFATGDNAEQIRVTGADGEVPQVDFPTPLTSDKIETKVITEGAGPKFTGDESLKLEFVALNGGTGEAFQSTKFDGTDSITQIIASGQYPDFCHALSGVRAGSRVAVLFPAKFAHQGEGAADLGISATDSLVYVLDVLAVTLPYATGAEQPAEAGFPAVVRSAKGVPGITMPTGDAPADFKVSTLLKGVGETVKLNDEITVHYSGFLWGGDKFESTWDSGTPTQFELAEGQLIPGFIKALVGQTVGSQVIAIIPPEDGYGSTATGSIPADSTLIFVIDILATSTPGN